MAQSRGIIKWHETRKRGLKLVLRENNDGANAARFQVQNISNALKTNKKLTELICSVIGSSLPSCPALPGREGHYRKAQDQGLKGAGSTSSSASLADFRHVALFSSKLGSLQYNGKNNSAFWRL